MQGGRPHATPTGVHAGLQDFRIALPARPLLSAGALLQGWQGALMRARVSRDLTPLRNFVDLEFSRLLDSY
jgi:hypothetical protein